MTRHTERYIAWFDMEAPRGRRWKVLDLGTDDPATSSGKLEMAGVRNSELAHSMALDMEGEPDDQPGVRRGASHSRAADERRSSA